MGRTLLHYISTFRRIPLAISPRANVDARPANKMFSFRRVLDPLVLIPGTLAAIEGIKAHSNAFFGNKGRAGTRLLV